MHAHELKRFSPKQALLFRDPATGAVAQVMVPAAGADAEIAAAVAAHPGADAYLSESSFRGWRSGQNLEKIRSLYVDLDIHKLPQYSRCTPEQLLAVTLMQLSDASIPVPTEIVFSGRGLQLRWRLAKALPAAAQSRWSLCQRELVKRLASLNADPAAVDAARVLRLVGSTSSRSGETVRIVGGTGHLFDFDSLADELLPMSRAEYRAAKQQQWAAERERKAARVQLAVVPGGRAKAATGVSLRQQSLLRVRDIEKLIRIRGGVPEGKKTLTFFWLAAMALHAGVALDAREYIESKVGQLCAGWEFRQPELSTLAAKAAAMARGEPVTFAGRQWPAVYTPRTETLIASLEITPAEQAQLRVLVDSGELKARHDAARIERRRAAGVRERGAYLELAAKPEQRAAVVAARAAGASLRQLAAQFGLSVARVRQLLASSTVAPVEVVAAPQGVQGSDAHLTDGVAVVPPVPASGLPDQCIPSLDPVLEPAMTSLEPTEPVLLPDFREICSPDTLLDRDFSRSVAKPWSRKSPDDRFNR